MEQRWSLSYKQKLFWFLATVLFVQLAISGSLNAVKGSDLKENLLENPGFEELSDGFPTSWEAKEAWESGSAVVSSEAARTGDNGIKFFTETTNDYWLRQTVPVAGGKRYELSSWIKSDFTGGRGQIKVEFYQDATETSQWQGHVLHDGIGSFDDWERVALQMEVPPDANLARVYIRLYGPGTALYDDVSFHQIEDLPGVDILANRIFYDEDMTEGYVTGEIKPPDHRYDDKSLEVKIAPQEGGEAILHETGLSASEDFSFPFDPQLMNFQVPYILNVSLKNEEGATLLEDEETIYRWERPTNINEEGQILVDGKPFFPVVGYHVPVAYYPLVKESINTVQGIGSKGNHADTQYQLDEAHKHGLKVFFPLYPNFEHLDSSHGLQYVQEKVSRFKDHPAILGWMITDEPDQNEISLDDLAEVYRLIRTLDPENPTYMVISDGRSPDGRRGVDTYGRLTDIVAPDVYPLPRLPVTEVGKRIEEVHRKYPEKPIITILQAFERQPVFPAAPNITQLRNMAYQSILEGAQSFGYYAFTTPEWELMDSSLYPGMVRFNRKEMTHLSNFTLNGQRIDSEKNETLQWGLWESGDHFYAVVLNLTEDPQTATITLPNDRYYVETLAPEISQYSLFDHELDIELSELESRLIKLTPYMTSSEMHALVERFENEGAFENNGAARALKTHLIAIDLFEKQKTPVKVIKHLKGFKQLLRHQFEHELISDQAYERLHEQADALQQQTEETLLHVHTQLETTSLVAGENLRLRASIKNISDVSVQEPVLTIHWPEGIALDTEEVKLPTMVPDQTEEIIIDVQIPNDISIGDYMISSELTFGLNGELMGYTRKNEVSILPLLEVRSDQNRIRTTEPGSYSFSIDLTNNASSPIEIKLDGESEWSDDIRLVVNEPISLHAKQTKTIDLDIQMMDYLMEGEYPFTILTSVNGESKQNVSFIVEFTNNLLDNGDFERDDNGDAIPDGWKIHSGAWVQDEVYNGQYAMAMFPDPDEPWNVVTSEGAIPITTGATYRLSGWVKLGSSDGKLNIGIRESNSEGVTVQYNWEYVRGQSEWTYYELEFTPSRDSQNMQVYFHLPPDSEQPAWMDEFRIEDITDEMRNMIPNGGFELDEDLDGVPDGWNLRDGNSVQDVVYGGQYAVTLEPDPDNPWNVISTMRSIPINADESYRLSGWVKLASPDGQVKIGLREADKTNATIQYEWEYIENQSDWRFYEITIQPTEDTTSLQVFFHLPDKEEWQAWFDDFTLEKVET